MPRIQRPGGVTLELPESMRVVPDDERRRRRRGPGGRPAAEIGAAETGAVLEGLADQGLQLVDTLTVGPREDEEAPPAGRRRGRRWRRDETRTLTVSVDRAPDEEALLLVEQDGVYAWHMPTAPADEGRRARRRRGEPGAPGPDRAEFMLELRSEAAARRRERRRGFIEGLVIERAKLFVLKHVAGLAVDEMMSRQEADVRTGLVVLDDPGDLDAWRHLDDAAALDVPADGAPRVLLFIHGTFSSTRGSFGHLVASTWGRALLEDANEAYDAVIGYDHPTLSASPRDNAEDLRNRLVGLPDGAELDVVTFSRGGLVLRCLAEQLLPELPSAPAIRRVVFVGSSNSGTRLAEAENWHQLLDLYTNLVAGASRVATMLAPQTAVAGKLLREAFGSISALAKYVVSFGLDADHVPGLAALVPYGELVTALNTPADGTVRRPAGRTYYAITSDFDVETAQPGDLPELSDRLVLTLADANVDRLMGEPSDLVVNISSMTRVGPGDAPTAEEVDETFDFGGTNAAVYHTVYFTRPEVAEQLRAWLDLPGAGAADVDRATDVDRAPDGDDAGGPDGATDTDGVARAPERAVHVDRRVHVLRAAATVEDARAELEALERTIRHVIVARRETWDGGGRMLHYAFTPGELRAGLMDAPARVTLENALGLHEGDASLDVPADAVTPDRAELVGQPAADARPSQARSVALDEESWPAGVVAPVVRPASATELAAREAATEDEPARDAVNRRSRRRRRRGGGGPSPRPPRRRRRSGTPPPTAEPGPPGGHDEDHLPGEDDAARGEDAPPRTDEAAEREPTAAPSSPSTVTCHVRAEVPDPIQVGAEARVEVEVAREAVREALGRAAAAATAAVAEEAPIAMWLVARTNVRITGPDMIELSVPEPDEPAIERFTIEAEAGGPVEVWLDVRQQRQRLARLKLRTEAVDALPAGGGRRVAAGHSDVRTTAGDEQPINQLTILEKYVHEGGPLAGFTFLLEIPDVIVKTYDKVGLDADRATYVQSIYDEIERRWIASDEDIAVFEQDLQAFGMQLFDDLLPDGLRRDLWAHRDRIDAIRVISQEPFIPWEMVHLKAPDGGGPVEERFLAQMGLVRWLDGRAHPRALRVRRGRARYVVPDYPLPEDELPEAADERDYLEANFDATPITAEDGSPARSTDIVAVLKQPGAVDLLHFAGHCEAAPGEVTEAVLLLDRRRVDGDIKVDELAATTVRQLAQLSGGLEEDAPRTTVVMNACQSGQAGYRLSGVGGFASACLNAGAGAFIGALWSVTDAPARTLIEAFYDALLDGQTLAEASKAARAAAKDAGEGSWLAYTIYGHPYARLERD